MKRLKRPFIKLGYRVFNKLGLSVKILQSPKYLYENLQQKTYDVQVHELQQLSYFISASNDHDYYNEVLKLCVPGWNMKIKKARFIGIGGGGGSLKSFRRVEYGKTISFEKVYFTKSKDLETILWFDKHMSNELENIFKISRIQNIIKGELLTIVYMDFLNLEPLCQKNKENSLVELSKKMLEIDIDSFLAKSDNIPKQILDFRKHYLFKLNFELVKEELVNNQIDSISIINRINTSKRVFTHGDFIERNTAQQNIIIDWDSFGFFPLGMEQAYMYQFTYIQNKNQTFIEPRQWLIDNYFDFIDKNNWEVFEFNYSFFLLVFSWRYFMREKHLMVKNILIERISNSIKKSI